MASLYAIDQAIQDAISESVDPETGEIIYTERLEQLQMERDQKIEGVALWVKNLQADALAYKAEKEAFSKREKAATAKADSLKKWLVKALEGQKFSTTKCAVSFSRSEQVEIMDETIIPKNMMVQVVTFKPDKNVIKKLLKDGQEVSGCRLVENLNTQIK